MLKLPKSVVTSFAILNAMYQLNTKTAEIINVFDLLTDASFSVSCFMREKKHFPI